MISRYFPGAEVKTGTITALLSVIRDDPESRFGVGYVNFGPRSGCVRGHTFHGYGRFDTAPILAAAERFSERAGRPHGVKIKSLTARLEREHVN